MFTRMRKAVLVTVATLVAVAAVIAGGGWWWTGNRTSGDLDKFTEVVQQADSAWSDFEGVLTTQSSRRTEASTWVGKAQQQQFVEQQTRDAIVTAANDAIAELLVSEHALEAMDLAPSLDDARQAYVENIGAAIDVLRDLVEGRKPGVADLTATSQIATQEFEELEATPEQRQRLVALFG